MRVPRIEHRADFVQRSPLPDELHIGNSSLLGDAGDGHQFALCRGNIERLLFRIAGRDERLKRIHARWREGYIPAGRRTESGGARRDGAGDPAAMLQSEIEWRKIILVGNDTGTKFE